MKNNSIVALYSSTQTVFDLKDLMRFFAAENYDNAKALASYYVKQGILIRLRRGIYAKATFDSKELACKLYSPSYISFETILFENNIIHQRDSTIFVASYLSRTITIPYNGTVITLQYRKLKDELLFDQTGIQQQSYYMQASPERAMSDILYLKPDFYFDKKK